MNHSISRVIHARFVKTPVITDTLQLQAYRRGQWVKLAWCDKPSRYWGMNERGNVTAFHFPSAHSRFVQFCRAMSGRELVKVS